MIGLWLSRWPQFSIRRKGDQLGATRKVVSLASWSHLKPLVINEHVYIGPVAWLLALGGISIGTGSIIGRGLTVYSSNHDFFTGASIPNTNATASRKSVTLGQGCWLGDGVMLLLGTTFRDHCLVGAGSVVRGHVPSGSVLMGNLAKATRQLTEERLSAKYKAPTEERFHVAGEAP